LNRLVVLLAAGWCLLLYERIASVPDLAGGITVTCDGDPRIFVGERLMDSNPLFLSWTDLLAAPGNNPLAVEVGSNGGQPSVEEVIGAGALLLRSSPAGGFRTPHANAAPAEWLVRRANERLDHLWIVQLDWLQPSRQPRHLIVPIRIRAAAGKPTEYFSMGWGGSSAGWSPQFVSLLGRSPTRLDIEWTITRRPPNDVPQDVKSDTLWEPGESAGER
jgi:hypothetical protein